MSTAAQSRATAKYQAAHYTALSVRIDKETAAAFKQALNANGDTLAGWMKDRIAEYLGQPKSE